MILRRLVACLCAWVAATTALAPANPYGWEETQPDGSAAGRLYLKGHPDESVYIVDQHDHPVVVDDEGWYVYGSTSNSSTALRGQSRRRAQEALWYPTDYRISPDSHPPRHLQDEVLARSFPEVPNQVTDFLCQGQERSPWCPINKRLIGRDAEPPKTIGVTKTLVILVRFSDHTDRILPTREDYEFIFNGEGTNDDRAPTGTMQDFFRVQSLGKFTINAHVEDWITAPHDEAHYSYGNYGLTNLFAQAAYSTLDRMDAEGVDWSRFDEDNDGVLDSVVILHSGFVAEGGGTDCFNKKQHGVHRIWSHATSVPDNRDAWYSSERSVRIGRYCTTSALFGTCDVNIQRVGVIGHEILHTMGLPDLIGKPGTGVGIYDVMGMMWGPDGSLYYPATLSPWCRQRLGWGAETTITSSGEYGLTTAQYSGDVYRIDLSQGEYLLIENRQKHFMDAILPGDGGLLIWHIDDNMGNAWMSQPGWPLQEGWPGNGNHYPIALLSPDTRYDMETASNYGDRYDFWTSGKSLEPGPARQDAQASQVSMYPNTDTYSRGVIQQTGIRIYDISEPSDDMTFKVEIPGTPTEHPSPAPTSSPTVSPTPWPTESPTTSPTAWPTQSPTTSPTRWPTASPTPWPTQSPTTSPTSQSPTFSPTRVPTSSPTQSPSSSPTASPTVSPLPSHAPTVSAAPSESPTQPQTDSPTVSPSTSPTGSPGGRYEFDSKKTVIRRPFDYYDNNR